MTLCPSCNTHGLRRSRAHSALERLRARLGERRPYRCRVCGWRGWAVPTATTGHVDGEKPAPDLVALERTKSRPKAAMLRPVRLDETVDVVFPLNRRRSAPLDPRRLDESWPGTNPRRSRDEASSEIDWDITD